MLIVVVQVKVKPEAVEAFRKATIRNAQASRKEAGIARFDVLQQADDPTRFILVEAIGMRKRQLSTRRQSIIRPGGTRWRR
jgi:hypothetical protein